MANAEREKASARIVLENMPDDDMQMEMWFFAPLAKYNNPLELEGLPHKGENRKMNFRFDEYHFYVANPHMA